MPITAMKALINAIIASVDQPEDEYEVGGLG
jgi:hypothetical protein